MVRDNMLRVRMTDGEMLLLHAKAARERSSLSEVIRRAVVEYEPMLPPKPGLCPEEDEDVPMESILYDDVRELEVGDEKHTITITGIPAEKCPKCGTIIFDLDLMAELEKAELRMVNYFTRKGKEWPEKISIEELARLLDH
ncbi:YgiT-type zinc finger protein [Thermanaerosceptrum fracticalcis]|jgi:hypothetical protein|uniref:YgiT-type zinc finger protein n=1 Tax=Thermanaerosceptrum fracticalcis TaxID=1712410 RepID=A0A7G6E046_THEFR|nr:YgiT-type zinc finger protein [Thermanaerosceptrum fracticalcis]QNB45450.1 YgiT-type zinc finger protein [Thermanaerosceptrum fracticalcis]